MNRMLDVALNSTQNVFFYLHSPYGLQLGNLCNLSVGTSSLAWPLLD